MKLARHEKIMELIRTCEIETQEELSTRLKEAGFRVTQATVSRDIRALKLTKVTGKDGRSHYAVLDDSTQRVLGDKYARVLREGMVSVEAGQNLVVIRTVPGMAMAVAAAVDALRWSEVLGCIAGDDTIFCAARSADMALRLTTKLRDLGEFPE